jgi:hypothetical protein
MSPQYWPLALEVGRFFLQVLGVGIAMWVAIVRVIGNHIKHVHEVITIHNTDDDRRFQKLDQDLEYIRQRLDRLLERGP